jgi:hypothetical protein
MMTIKWHTERNETFFVFEMSMIMLKKSWKILFNLNSINLRIFIELIEHLKINHRNEWFKYDLFFWLINESQKKEIVLAITKIFRRFFSQSSKWARFFREEISILRSYTAYQRWSICYKNVDIRTTPRLFFSGVDCVVNGVGKEIWSEIDIFPQFHSQVF